MACAQFGVSASRGNSVQGMAANRRHRVLAGLVGALLADGTFNAIALYDLAQSTGWGRWSKEWAKADLDRLRFPEELRFLFPIIKYASVLGLAVGVRWRWMGRLTSAALVAYFVLAVGFHARAKDPPRNHLAALVMLAWSYMAWRLFASGERRDVS
jgi:DoxX-like family